MADDAIDWPAPNERPQPVFEPPTTATGLAVVLVIVTGEGALPPAGVDG